jgi:flagellar biosynthesis protein
MEPAQKVKKVVGLKYEPGQGPPQVIVKGSGPASDEILRRGALPGGPVVVEDAALAEQLYKLPMDASIGPELYELVAVLLAHVFQLEQNAKGEKP